MTNDKHIDDRLLAYLSGNLDASAGRIVEEHLASCESCRKELASLGGVWNAIGRLPEEQPGEGLRSRFYEAMRAYEAALQGTAFSPAKQARRWYESLVPRSPAIRFATALLLLVVAGAIGYRMRGGGVEAAEMSQLRDEVRSVNHLLTVSLLRQQSASERLQGVNRSSRMERVDPEIAAALLQTFKHDPNVNVRLAALDALSRDIDEPEIRTELLAALQIQSSPMVQIAIIDLLVQAGEKQSTGVLKQMLQKADVNTVVKKRIEAGIQELNS
jgi:hypothetical protein